MKKFLMLGFTVLSLNLFALTQVGQTVQNFEWNDVNGQKVRLEDFKGNVRVLLYNAGWCGPCNAEFAELSRRVGAYAGKAVTFISLSSNGWTGGSAPDITFLRSWKARFRLPDSFVVAAAPRDAGINFIPPPIGIPNVAIVDKEGKLFYRAVSPGVPAILAQVNRLLAAK